MTVSSTLRKVVLNGNGIATAFPFSYKVFSKTDLRGIITDADGLETELVLDSDFSVVLNADQDNSPGGTVTYPISGSPLITGRSLTLLSNVPYLQSTDITDAGGFYPQVIEDALDRNVIQIQQNKELLDRALTIPVAVSGVSTDLPAPEADSVIGWNNAGTALQNIALTTLATVVAFGTAQADIFLGNGVATAFVLTANPGSLYNMDVSIGGVTQLPGTDYTWSGGTTLTTTSPVPNGIKLLVRYMQGMPSGITAANAVTYADTDVATSLLSRVSRVVNSIATLKTVDKTKYTRAFVTGYYAAGDGGGGSYWYDSTDAASADNGGSVIVANDGARWKLLTVDGVYSVRQFGAKGDNTTDDTTAIQNCINAAQAFAGSTLGTGGGVVWINPGSYKITATLLVGACSIRGSTMFTSLLKPTSTTHCMSIYNSQAPTVMEDFGILYDVLPAAGIIALKQTIPGAVGIQLNARYRNLFIQNFGTGFYTEEGSYWTMQDCFFFSPVANSVCMYVDNLANYDQGDITVTGCTMNAQLYGVHWVGADGFRFVNNKIIGPSYGIHLNPHAGNNSSDIIISGNSIEGIGANCIVFTRQGSPGVMNCVQIIGNQMGLTATGTAISVPTDGAGSWIVNLTVTDNIIVGPQGASSLGIGIDDVNGFVVANNVMNSQYSGGGGTQFISIGGAAANGIVHDNAGSGTFVASVNGSATTKIRNSPGWVNTNKGSGAIAAAATSAVISHGLSAQPVNADVKVNLTNLSTNDPGEIYIDTVTATQFTVHCRNVPGVSTLTFDWKVEL